MYVTVPDVVMGMKSTNVVICHDILVHLHYIHYQVSTTFRHHQEIINGVITVYTRSTFLPILVSINSAENKC